MKISGSVRFLLFKAVWKKGRRHAVPPVTLNFFIRCKCCCWSCRRSGPVRVEKFTTRFINAFVRVGAEIITLRLQQIRPAERHCDIDRKTRVRC